jgi:hypothetical protein
VNWYSCSSAHSQPLNANRKAYAAWWLWAVLAGWNPATDMGTNEFANPKKFKLYQNYPNPFNSTTSIGFQLQKNSHITIIIFSSLGEKVATILESNYQAGYHSIVWNGRDDAGNLVPSGLYVYQIETENYFKQAKMIILK